MKPRMHISFSGGLTSAYMVENLRDKYHDQYEFIITYANTGLEHEKTLEFIRKCDEQRDFKTIWLEAVIHPEKRVGTTHKIIDFDSATRDGSIFEAMIEKYGIPNKVYKHCTRELKVRPMNSYLRSLGIKPNHIPTAIGIRADEARRMMKDPTVDNIIYPLVTATPVDKQFVWDYWEAQPFTLGLPEWEGNCNMCFEKSDAKLLKQLETNPNALDFHIRMEQKHGQTNNQPGKPNRVFFRGNRSGLDILNLRVEKSAP